MPEDLGQKAARGAAVTAVSLAGRVAIQILSLALLARLLVPDDYGLVAIAFAIIGLGHMLRDMGLFTSAVRAPHLSAAQRDNLFWINTGLGILLGIVCCGVAPVLAAAYGREELTGITLGLALTFVLSGLATQYRASLVRDLRFTGVAMGDLASQATGAAVAVVIAMMGGGYWALVAQHWVSGTTFLVLAVTLSGWLPGRYKRTERMGSLLRLGGTATVSSLFTYVSNNIDSVVIGARYGVEPVGLYNRGTQLVRSTLKQFSSPVAAVALPVMGRLQNDEKRLMAFAHKVQLGVGYPTAFAVAVIAGAPEEVVRVALGDGWGGTSTIVLWMAVAALLAVIGDVAGLVLVARGAIGQVARLSIATTCLNLAGVLVGVTWGPAGVARGLAVAALVNAPIAFIVLSRSARLPTRIVVLGGVRLVLVAGTGALAVRLLLEGASFEPLATLVLASLVALGWIACLGILVPRVKADLHEVLGMARAALGRVR